MKMLVALISGLLISSAAMAHHEHATTGHGSENVAAAPRPAGEAAGNRSSGGNHANANSTANAERRICRRLASTGSRMGSDRVCLTAEQWRQYERDND
ncbi:MAG: hypothetical protein ACT4OE_07480 [Sphingosinicella sp.]